MRPSRVILVLALALLLGIASARAQDPCTSAVEPKGQAGAYSFWTGPRDGYYDKVGHALAYSAAHSGIKIDPVISNGSVENICALVQGRADFALVQSDAAHLASYGEEPFSQKYTAPTMVTPIFVEKVHILIRPHLYISSPAGLTRPHSVWMGPENSGSQLSAQLVLLASGKSQAEIAELKATPSPTNFDEALKSLKSWELDAVFETDVAPAANIAAVLKDKTSEIRLLGLVRSSVELLTKNGMYIDTSLQKTEYPQLDGDIYTVGVEALLLTRSDVNDRAVTTLAKILHDQGHDIITHLQLVLAKDSGLNVDPSKDFPISWRQSRNLIEPQSLSLLGTRVPDGIAPPADKRVAGFLWAYRIPKEAAIRILILIIVLLLVCAGLFHPYGRNLAGQNMRLLLFLLGYVILLTIGGVWLQAIEGGLNQHFTTLLASCFSLGENVVAKLQIPIPSLPTPTSQHGVNVMTWFSWIGFVLLTAYAYPMLKRTVPEIWRTKIRQSLAGKG